MDHRDDGCNLCASDGLTFEPPPIHCTPCGARIHRYDIYYTVGSVEIIRYFFCDDCCNNNADGETIFAGGTPISITLPEKKVNDNAAEEQWVQCAKCASWQHQICAMFSHRRNDGGKAEYTCPNCYIDPWPPRNVLGAKDLPRTNLSDHIEQRLFEKLKQERQYRAKAQGKSFDKIPGPVGLFVRVVSSFDKKLEVKQRFKDIFQEENYPTEFPYKSKVILLFQQIEGVEVCLFGIRV